MENFYQANTGQQRIVGQEMMGMSTRFTNARIQKL